MLLTILESFYALEFNCSLTAANSGYFLRVDDPIKLCHLIYFNASHRLTFCFLHDLLSYVLTMVEQKGIASRFFLLSTYLYDLWMILMPPSRFLIVAHL
jgi:hypothetical protein